MIRSTSSSSGLTRLIDQARKQDVEAERVTNKLLTILSKIDVHASQLIKLDIPDAILTFISKNEEALYHSSNLEFAEEFLKNKQQNLQQLLNEKEALEKLKSKYQKSIEAK